MLKCLFYHYPVRGWFPVYVYDESRKDMTQMSGSLDISKIITLYHYIYTCYLILSISRYVHVLYDPYRYHVHNINSERYHYDQYFYAIQPLCLIIRCFFIPITWLHITFLSNVQKNLVNLANMCDFTNC